MQSVVVQDSPNSKTEKRDLHEVTNSIKKFNDYLLLYRNFAMDVYFHEDGHYIGYIHEFPLGIRGLFSLEEQVDFSKVKGVHKPHGGFSLDRGFDCGHSYDILVCDGHPKNTRKGKSFKTRKFVEEELARIVDSLHEVAASRQNMRV